MKIELQKGTTERFAPDALALSGSFEQTGRIEVAASAYAATNFFIYHLQLGQNLPPFPPVDGRRTVWLPAVGMKDGCWHDGALAVTEPDGTISSYLPTGTPGSLLLAPDGTNAMGWAPDRVTAIEGTKGAQLLRGAIAAVRDRISGIDGTAFTAALPPEAAEEMPPVVLMVWLTLLRAALGPERTVYVSFDPQVRISPRLRRCCEHTGIVPASWSEPDIDLAGLFEWYQAEWTDGLVHSINANGDIIPG
jgi:hypothetical protein